MERYSDKAIRIIDSLHTERLDYHSEYLPLIDAAQRLAAYENTCLEPEEIDAQKFLIAAQKDPVKLARIRELVQADRDGRCVVLPCKVGDVLYSAFPLCGINTHQVRKFERNSEGDFACSALMIPLSDFGKTVFLTRESAETALEKRRDDHGIRNFCEL